MADLFRSFIDFQLLPNKIFDFYENLTKNLAETFKISEEEIRISLDYHRSHYTPCSGMRDPIYDNISNCIAYIFKNAPCHSAMVCEVVSIIINSLRAEKSPWTNGGKTDDMKVIFLGSGSGNDALGFLAALAGIPLRLKSLNITVVDKYSGWERVLNEAMQSVERGDFPEIQNVLKSVEIKTKFVHANLTDSSKKTMRKFLKKTNIVFMVKVMSVIPQWEKLNALKNVVEQMDPGAVLVIIDFPIPDEIHAFAYCLQLIFDLKEDYYCYPVRHKKYGYNVLNQCKASVNIFRKF